MQRDNLPVETSQAIIVELEKYRSLLEAELDHINQTILGKQTHLKTIKADLDELDKSPIKNQIKFERLTAHYLEEKRILADSINSTDQIFNVICALDRLTANEQITSEQKSLLLDNVAKYKSLPICVSDYISNYSMLYKEGSEQEEKKTEQVDNEVKTKQVDKEVKNEANNGNSAALQKQLKKLQPKFFDGASAFNINTNQADVKNDKPSFLSRFLPGQWK